VGEEQPASLGVGLGLEGYEHGALQKELYRGGFNLKPPPYNQLLIAKQIRRKSTYNWSSLVPQSVSNNCLSSRFRPQSA